MSAKRECSNCEHSSLISVREPCYTCIDGDDHPYYTPKIKLENIVKSDQETKALELLVKWGFVNAAQYPQMIAELSYILTENANLKPAIGGGSDHPLYEAFDDAVAQATKGKGVRHGGEATPFLTQPIFQIAKHTGVGGLVFQMVKKAQEACGKDDQEAFERELLGALVYGGAAYVYVKQHGFKKVAK